MRSFWFGHGKIRFAPNHRLQPEFFDSSVPISFRFSYYDGNMKWRKNEFLIDTNKKKLNLDFIHSYLSEHSYWATGRSRETIQRSIRHSLSFGIYDSAANQQIGFGRVITDYATFAWIADVFVIENYRGRGLAKWLMEIMIAHPKLQRFRRWVLATKDAHELYRRYGFVELQKPDRWMERRDPTTEERPDYWQDTEVIT